jgi:cyanophycinase
MTPLSFSSLAPFFPPTSLGFSHRGTGARIALVALMALLLFLPPACAADAPAAAIPQLSVGLAAGSLVIVGGGSPLPDTVRDRFLELAGSKNAHLVIIPTASDKADFPELLKTPAYFRALNLASVTVLHTHSRKQADDPAFVKPLTEATGVWFCGGTQSRLVDAYRGTLVERELRNLLARGGVIAGTSAGAAVMSQVMILGGNPQAEVGDGFGFLQGVVVDQHFQNRHRLTRLLGVLAKYPQYAGLGIDEQTAIVVTGHSLTVLGNGAVSVCLPQIAQQDASVQLLKTGAHADLLELCRTALARIHPAPPTKPAAVTGRAAASP